MSEVKTIGVLTSGGDAPGMNAFVRSVVRAGINKGMRVIGIRRGYNGLIHGDMVEMDMRSVSDIIHRGGTVLYTARCPEFKEQAGIEMAKRACEEAKIDGVIVGGGDGSFRGAADLSAAGVPCIGVPCTIDNDIACSDYTIGYDTAMNTAMEMIDKLRDTSQSHYRCSVVEVMGRRAGYIALNCGLASGATHIVVPEIEFKFEDVVAKMQQAQSTGKHHFIILVAEGIGNVEELAKRIQEATGVESRATILGHVQRGGNPTAHDRVVASQMGHYAVTLLQKGIGNRVVALKDSHIVDYSIQEALKMKKPFDYNEYQVADDISY